MDKQFVWIWLENDGTYAIDFSILNHPDGKNIVTKLDGEEINERMLPVYTDDKGRLWLRDDKSLVIYSLQNEAIVKRLDAASGINSIVYGVYQTPDAFWLTSRSDGVIRVNKKTLSVEKKTT